MTEPTEPNQSSPSEQGNLEHIVKVWEKSVDLQMHFNEICMNLRRTAISSVGALLAAGAIAFRFGGNVQIINQSVSVAFLFAAVAVIVWISFYAMDRFWYHELLRAAVKYAESLEEPASRAGLPMQLNMSSEIRKANHTALRISGGAKINLFYLIVAFGLLVGCWCLYAGVIQPAPTSTSTPSGSATAPAPQAPAVSAASNPSLQRTPNGAAEVKR